jgi:copper(I)-binding protein
MTEDICDFCGVEISQTSPDAIRIHNAQKGGGLHNMVMVPVKQILDANRHVSVIIKPGDFCSIDHYADFLKRELNKSR